ncbi:MAG: hypothetical protein WAL69_03280 [Candidatus Acidiferrales bacterium]
MKLVTATFATVVLLALAGVAPSAYAQAQEQQQQDKQHAVKPAHPQEQQKPSHPQTARPPQQKQTQRPQTQQEQPRQQEQRQQQKAQHTEQKNQQKAQEQQQKTQQKAQRAQQEQQQKTQQRTASHPRPSRTQRAQAAPARGGQPVRGNPQQTAHYEQAHFRRYTPQHDERVVRIPDAQFSAHFGQGHRFHIGPPMMVGGFPRFQYGGFWFVLEEPWPGYWGYGSDFYIVFTDGDYWLCDYDDPGVEIQLAVIA